ncbi:hypothetical protein YTPLAS18_37710 [Nitrospira sp.]|nr:hypothetical protein YTPLAS18_37710 [Nitrospira sp.]
MFRTRVHIDKVSLMAAASMAVLLWSLQTHPAAAEEAAPADAPAAAASAAPAESDVSPEPAGPTETTPIAGESTNEPAEDTQQPDREASPSVEASAPPVTPLIRISGNIWRMNPGIVFLRTPIGLVTLSCKTCLRNVRGGPTVTLFVHGSHGAVTITPRGSGSPTQRYLWGPLSYATPDKKALRLWTPDGDEEFLIDSVARKLASFEAGRNVTVEVDAAGKILGIHDLHYDLQVSQLPSHSSQTEMQVTGSVSKIKNGYVHVKTRVGMLPITGKTGLCRKKNQCQVKVGQDLTLWIHDTSVAIDLYDSGSTALATRLLSGKLTYDGPEKKALSLWTPDGEASIPTDQAKDSLSSLKEGTPIIVELDGDGAVHTIRKGS